MALDSRGGGGPAFVFVVDTCCDEDELRALKNELLHVLAQLPKSALVGLVTVDSMVSVHEIGHARCSKICTVSWRAGTFMGSLSQVPMAPSAAAMAVAQAIVAAQALQSQIQAQNKALKDSSGLPDAAGKADAVKRTLQVRNLSPLLQGEHLKQLFSYCGSVVDCSITESKHFAYIEYSKEEETVAALALNNIDVGGRSLNVEMAKSLPSKPASLNSSLGQSSLPMVMQQAVAMQQLQFQQSLRMQQTMNAQQAANRAATMKSATELASARAAEISKKLKADGVVTEDKDANRKFQVTIQISPSNRLWQ